MDASLLVGTHDAVKGGFRRRPSHSVSVEFTPEYGVIR
jgi:hypothetical protein